MPHADRTPRRRTVGSLVAALLVRARCAGGGGGGGGDEGLAVFAMACSYREPQLGMFVRSLRLAGYGGDVHIGASHMGSTAGLLRKYGVTGHAEPCEYEENRTRPAHGPRKDRWLGSLNQRRYLYYRRWLYARRGGARYERVWLLDARDLVFVAHPFRGGAAAALGELDLALFAETSRLTEWELARVHACLGEQEASAIRAAAMPNVCGGTVYGRGAAIETLCAHMLAASDASTARFRALEASGAPLGEAALGCARNDQFLLNHVAHAHRLAGRGASETAQRSVYGRVRVFAPGEGPVLTLKAYTYTCPSAEALLGPLPIDPQSAAAEEARAAGRALPKLRAPGGARGALLGPLPIVHKWNQCDALRVAACAQLVPTKRVPLICRKSVVDEYYKAHPREQPPRPRPLLPAAGSGVSAGGDARLGRARGLRDEMYGPARPRQQSQASD